MTTHTFTAGFLFAGLGAGARGFLEAAARLGQAEGRFRNLGGVDIDPEACKDFELLTGGRATQADLATMTPAALRTAWGAEAPDCVFLSPPCKGFSKLNGKERAAEEKYQLLNQLALQGIWLLLETWPKGARGAGLPALLVLENVPGITGRGAALLAQIRQILTSYGYLLHEASHDCGEIGGLAQHRRRYLLVARQPARVPAFVYLPPRRRVRACGEVLRQLPLPNDPAAGPLHRLPNIDPVSWVRLALIPAGGDHRDLPRRGAVAIGEKTARCARKYKGSPRYYGVGCWEEPWPTVTGSASVSGSNALAAVADPRLLSPVSEGLARRSVQGRHGVLRWEEAARTVAGSGSNAASHVADPRLALGCKPRDGAYGVLPWTAPSATITGSMHLDNGRAAVADPRPLPAGYHLLSLEEAIRRFNADPDRALAPEGSVPVIQAPDGTWHRPLTPLEFAALQGLPAELNGQPLQLSGRSGVRHRERIGNAVPVGAARAIAESLLTALLSARLGGTFSLSAEDIWVRQALAAEAR